MLSRRIGRIQRLGAVAQVARPAGAIQKRCLSQVDVEDPNMVSPLGTMSCMVLLVLRLIFHLQNGGYVNPPAIKRQFRDPHGDWWDKQQRRNYGEPVHEDDDILGLFSPEEYTHTKPATAFFQIGCFITAVFGLCGVVYVLYPDKQSYPKEYEGGLEKELGGPGVVRVSRMLNAMLNTITNFSIGTKGRRSIRVS